MLMSLVLFIYYYLYHHAWMITILTSLFLSHLLPFKKILHYLKKKRVGKIIFEVLVSIQFLNVTLQGKLPVFSPRN